MQQWIIQCVYEGGQWCVWIDLAEDGFDDQCGYEVVVDLFKEVFQCYQEDEFEVEIVLKVQDGDDGQQYDEEGFQQVGLVMVVVWYYLVQWQYQLV